jgi:hypothetical protein
LEERGFSLGVGVLFADRHLYESTEREPKEYPTGHLRIGSRSKRYFSLGVLESVPLYSGGGFFDAGWGFRPAPWADVWLGGSFGGPYDSPGMLVKLNLRPMRHWSVGANLRRGTVDGSTEHGIGLVIGYDIVY